MSVKATYLPDYDVFTIDYDLGEVAGDFVTVTFRDSASDVSETHQHNNGVIAAHVKGPYPRTDKVTIDGDGDMVSLEFDVVFDTAGS